MKELALADVLIGSYSDGKEAPAVYLYKAAEKKAEAILSQINPSYILKHQGYYYVVTEHKEGLIVVLDPNFKVISRVKSMGDDPCHLSIDNTGNYLVATNYTSGSTIICKLTNHIPSLVHSFITHEGSSNHPQRQTSPHPHSTIFSEDNKILFLADLGTDWIHYYHFTEDSIAWDQQKSLKIQNSGPRTLALGKEGSKLLYLTCQLDNTLRVLSYKEDKLQQVAAYQLSSNPNNYLSDVHYISGQLYVALRGDDKIMIFGTNEQKLEHSCSFKVGSWPRTFAISPNGNLFVACQKANLVQKYFITPEKILLISQLQIVTPSVVVII